MRLNSKLTWGLAWAGLALVLAVPSADFITSRLGAAPGTAVVMTSDTTPVTGKPTAPAETPTTKVTTVKTDKGIRIVPTATGTTAASDDPVDKYLSSGKPLPDYISDGDAPADTAPATREETKVAAVEPVPVNLPRMPLPASARPSPLPAMPAASQPEPVVIVDETASTGSIALPPADPMVDDSANWETESLRDYLERRGILEGDPSSSSVTVTERNVAPPPNNYDPDGFYLSDGPNGDRTQRLTRREQILRMLEEGDEDGFTLF